MKISYNFNKNNKGDEITMFGKMLNFTPRKRTGKNGKMMGLMRNSEYFATLPAEKKKTLQHTKRLRQKCITKHEINE